MDAKAPEVVIAVKCGGFGGLYAARSLAKTDVRVALIDRRNFHLFQPLLYQVATGGLSPGQHRCPPRDASSCQSNARVCCWEKSPPSTSSAAASSCATASRCLTTTSSSPPVPGTIIFGKPEWEALAPGLKTIAEDATEIHRRILMAFLEYPRAAEISERSRT